MKKTKPAPASNAETQNDLCVLTGEAEKINPHSTGQLHWEMTENLDGERGCALPPTTVAVCSPGNGLP